MAHLLLMKMLCGRLEKLVAPTISSAIHVWEEPEFPEGLHPGIKREALTGVGTFSLPPPHMERPSLFGESYTGLGGSHMCVWVCL